MVAASVQPDTRKSPTRASILDDSRIAKRIAPSCILPIVGCLLLLTVSVAGAQTKSELEQARKRLEVKEKKLMPEKEISKEKINNLNKTLTMDLQEKSFRLIEDF